MSFACLLPPGYDLLELKCKMKASVTKTKQKTYKQKAEDTQELLNTTQALKFNRVGHRKKIAPSQNQKGKKVKQGRRTMPKNREVVEIDRVVKKTNKQTNKKSKQKKKGNE